jgi:predicted NACHT family NTPase
MNLSKEEKELLFLGGPGAGKTTFLKFLALSYSDKETFATTNLVNSLIPFFVALPVLARSNKEIFDFLLHPIKLKTNEYSTEYLRRILTKGYAVILLDSLDEVPISQRTQLLEKIRSFCGIYPNTKVVISCRTADYQGDMLDAFNEIEIAKLSKPAVGKIIKAWFTEEPERAKELVTIIENDTSISSLTETPLLLSLICIQFKHDLALPRRKVELFNRCSQTLLREWDTTRRFRRETAYQSLTDQAKERLFEEIAFHFTKEGLTFIFPKAATIQVVSNFCSRVSLEPSDAIGMLAEIDSHHGILEQFSQDHYGFSHTSFQDFFAARAISSRGLGLKYIQTNIDNSDWHSIFEFIVALEQDADPIVNFLVAKSTLKGLTNYPPMAKRTDWLRLLYRCLATGPYISPPTRRQALNHLVESQFEIARIYGEGGVYPLSQLLSDGIRHPYVYSHKRPSLKWPNSYPPPAPTTTLKN